MGELFIIFGFITLTALVVIQGVRSIVNRQLDHKERMASVVTSGGGIAPDDYRRLEERVRVLERIATENRNDLAAQIEQLRDLDSIELRTANREISA